MSASGIQHRVMSLILVSIADDGNRDVGAGSHLDGIQVTGDGFISIFDDGVNV